MSDERPACRVSLHRLPQIHGKKSVKIEQFHARYWRGHTPTLFYPPVPGRHSERENYFKERYRVRIDGKFYTAGRRFTMLTQAEVDALVNEILGHGEESGY